MKKIQLSSFFSGFTSILDIFQPVKLMELSKGGFAEDMEKLCQDSKRIQQDFSMIVNAKGKSSSKANKRS